MATIIGAMVMSVIATTIFTTNGLRQRADDRSQFAGDVSVASLSFDRDGAMATKGASARTQTSSTSCATPIAPRVQRGRRERPLSDRAGSPSGPSWRQRVNGAGSRPLVKNVTACTWQTVRVGSGRYTIVVTMTLLGASGETMSKVMRAAPRLWP